MTEKKSWIPLAPIRRKFKEIEPDMRVSEEAIKYMVEKLEEVVEEFVKKAIDAAKHAKRKTVMKEDIDMAFQALK